MRISSATTQRLIAGAVGSPLFWVAFLAVPFGWPIYKAMTAVPSPTLPVFEQLPTFEAVDQENRSVDTAHLEGEVWVASFLASSDAPDDQVSAGPLGEIQYRARNLGQEFAMVTFVTDGQVEVGQLDAYAHRHRVSPRTWHLLKAPQPELMAAAGRSAEERLGGALSEADQKKLSHGSFLMLVDQRSRIRGVYEGSLEAGRDALLHDTGLLINRGR